MDRAVECQLQPLADRATIELINMDTEEIVFFASADGTGVPVIVDEHGTIGPGRYTLKAFASVEVDTRDFFGIAAVFADAEWNIDSFELFGEHMLVPEPGKLGLFALGFGVLALRRRRAEGVQRGAIPQHLGSI